MWFSDVRVKWEHLCVERTRSPCCLEMIRSVSQSSLFPTRRSSASSEAYWHKTESRKRVRTSSASLLIKVKADYCNEICSAHCHDDNLFISTAIKGTLHKNWIVRVLLLKRKKSKTFWFVDYFSHYDLEMLQKILTLFCKATVRVLWLWQDCEFRISFTVWSTSA